MHIVPALSAPEFDNPHKISARMVLDEAPIQVALLTLQPGERLKPHTTPVDATFYVIEGEGICEIEGERVTLHTNDLVFSPARHVHLLWNEGDQVFRFLVLKTPRPAKTGSV